jgi:hypothetical protein
VLRALIGMCYIHDQPGWQSTVVRLLDVFVDGLRVRSPAGGKLLSSPPRPVGAKTSVSRRPRR